MSSDTITTTINQPLTATTTATATVAAVREALGDQGFGVLTGIDLKASLKDKLDVDVDPQVILGACRPSLAHEAIQPEPSIEAVLPCNVVVRAIGQNTTLVEAFDPDAMMGLADSAALGNIAKDAKQRLGAAFAALEHTHGTRRLTCRCSLSRRKPKTKAERVGGYHGSRTDVSRSAARKQKGSSNGITHHLR